MIPPPGLSLKRKVGMSFVCDIGGGDVVRVTVEDIRGGWVTLRVAAPEDVRIVRSELLDVAA